MATDVQAALDALSSRLTKHGIADALWVGGSLATGDYVPGVSDLDLVAVASQRLSGEMLTRVAEVHEELDAGLAQEWTWAVSTRTPHAFPTPTSSIRRGLMARWSTELCLW